MRWLIVNTDYPDFLRQLYAADETLARRSYAEQWQSRVDSLFGVADFYSTHLRELDHEAWDVIINAEPMQKQWAREQGLRCARDTQWQLRWRRGFVPWPTRAVNRRWLYDILEAQLKHYRPDVLYSMAIEALGSDFVRVAKRYCRLVIGQHAAPLPTHDLGAYDLMLSSLPNLVDHFRAQGLRSEFVRLAFEPRVLQHLAPAEKQFDIAFVGGLGGPHDDGTRMLGQLARRHAVHVWGYGRDRLAPDSPLRATCGPPLWGRAMYQTLRNARIVFNRHIDVAANYANNMRLYEATGVGTLLLTDRKDNLAQLFEPGRDVVAYGDLEECVALAAHYLAHDDERERIAQAGQARTLREHTWAHRMRELVEIASRYL
ncbi:MAG TPA: glycosyltransferase [Phycisphaerae bacterium]|nr:glycosyltransferase [Phycisphaerae bacterium]